MGWTTANLENREPTGNAGILAGAWEQGLSRQLQVTGSSESVSTLGRCLLEEALCEPAAQALIAIQAGAAKPLRRALREVSAKNRLTLIHALAVLADDESVEALKEAAGDEVQDVRLAALWGLARMGRPDAVELALQAANAEGWERIQGVKVCLLLGESLEQNGRDQAAQRLYRELGRTRRTPSEDYVTELLAVR